jgi:hypothetical protein
MGKHKYSEEFLKKINSTEVENRPVGQEGPILNLTHKAYGMYSIEEGNNKRYVVIELSYDPETGKSGSFKRYSPDIKEDATVRFKIESENNILSPVTEESYGQ